MPTITAEHTVAAPRERVFEIFSDIPNCAERISAVQKIEMLSDVTHGVGTRWRETRVFMGKEAIEELEITAFEPPSQYVIEAESHGTHYLSTFHFEPLDDGRTLVRLSFVATPRTLGAKLGSPVMALMKGGIRKMLLSDMQELGAAAESAAADSSSATAG